MPSFPDPAPLAREIATHEIDTNLSVDDLIQGLLANRYRQLSDLTGSDDLGFRMVEDPDAGWQELGVEIARIRNAIAAELWARELFVSAEVLDDLLISVLGDASVEDPIHGVLEALERAKVQEHGFVLLPLIDFGVYGDLDALLRPRQLGFASAEWGVALTPQTNRFDETLAFIEAVKEAFGVPGQTPVRRLEHWRRSRPTQWLERNALLAVSVSQFTGLSYYGSERLLMSRVRAATAVIAMLAAIQPSVTSRLRSFSSKTINNSQTLDVGHYLILSPAASPDQELEGALIPVSGARPDVVEMSELAVELDADSWVADAALASEIYDAVEAVYLGYLQSITERRPLSGSARRYWKAFQSLAYFKRSFSNHSWRSIISLGVAFELVLLDGSHKSVAKRIRKRIKDLFDGADARAHDEAFSDTYAARGEIVHEGEQLTEVDLPAARRAFVACFQAVSNELAAQ